MSSDNEDEVRIRDAVRQVRTQLGPSGSRRLIIMVLLTVVLGGAAMLALTGASMWWTSQPSFCDSCHPMEPFVKEWAVSSHKSVNCEKCHTTPGLFGFIGGKIAGLQVVANYVKGDFTDSSFNAVVSNASCLQCHEEIMEKNIHTDGAIAIVVSHKNIIESGGKCNFCHSTVAHGDAVPEGSRTHPTMSACMKCHDDKTAPLKCELCHPGEGKEKAVPAAKKKS